MERSELGWAPEDDPAVSGDELEAALGRVVGAGKVRRARRRAAFSGLAVLALVLAGAGIVQLADNDKPSKLNVAGDPKDEVTMPSLPETGDEVTSTTQMTVANPIPVPSEVFVARSGENSGSEIVVLDTTTKAVKRVVYQEPYVLISDISVTPDHQWIYFQTESCGYGLLERVRVEGGPEGKASEKLSEAPSFNPEVSPDGKQVAYIAAGECGEDTDRPEYQLRVQDVATKAEHVVARSTEFISSPTWSPNGKSIAVAATRGDTEGHLVVFDAAGRDQGLSKGTPIPPARKGWGVRNPHYLKDGTLFVIEFPLLDTDGVATMSVVNPMTGKKVRSVATGAEDREYSGTEADPSGEHLLYLSKPKERFGSELRLASHGNRTVVLAEDVEAASW